MPNTFMIKTYKNLLEKRAYDIQKALLPATVDLVTTQIELENIKEKMKKNTRHIYELIKIKNRLYIRSDTNSEYKTILNEIKQIKTINRNLQIEYNNNGSYVNPSQNKEKNNFIRACTSETCRGFINELFICGLCDKKTCKCCYKIIEEGHTCNNDDILTTKLLLNDTKPCPTCQEGIFKIDGCDQMWCVYCHTAFSWKSGRIETQIHNPHFYNWMRANNQTIPRAHGDNVENNCQQFNDGYNMLNYMNSLITVYRSFILQFKPTDDNNNLNSTWVKNIPENYIFSYFQINELSNLIVRSRQLSGHIDYEIRNIQQKVDVEDVTKTNLRIQYLRQQIDENEFILKIQRVEKDCNKKRDIINVLNLLYTGLNDIMSNAYNLSIEVISEKELRTLTAKSIKYIVARPKTLNNNKLILELHKNNFATLNKIQIPLNNILLSICQINTLINYCDNLMKETRASYKAVKINIKEYFGSLEHMFDNFKNTFNIENI
jgi:hypothetical protein